MPRTAAVQPLRTPKLQIKMPPLHPGQVEIVTSPARFKVVCCGRQWGKTLAGAAMAVESASRGGDIWWVGPSFPIGELGWTAVDRLCRQIPGTKFTGRPTYRIEMPGGGSIQLRSAENPDSLRGSTLDGLVMDEAAQARPEAWPTLKPTLSIRQGWALFISTPRGDNWFHDLYVDAEKVPGWSRWRFPSGTNPYMSAEEMELDRAQMSAAWFAQEYEADFVSGGAGMFRQEWFRYWWAERDEAGQISGYHLGDGEVVPAESCTRFSTVDLAWSQAETADYTVIATWAVTPKKHLILLDAKRGRFEGPDIVPLMRQVYESQRPGYFAVERSTRQMNIYQEAVRTGLPVREVRADKSKVTRALPATARMESGTVWFPRGETWVKDFESELLVFPFGRHDDTVDVLAYAVLEVAGRSVYSDRGLMTV